LLVLSIGCGLLSRHIPTKLFYKPTTLTVI
jgi:hypothetical protein